MALNSTALAAARAQLDDYAALDTTLTNLPLTLQHEVMIPLGSVAFARGQVRRSNEVLVLLSAGPDLGGNPWRREILARAHLASGVTSPSFLFKLKEGCVSPLAGTRTLLVQEREDRLLFKSSGDRLLFEEATIFFWSK